MIPKKFLPYLFILCITLIPAMSRADPLQNWTTITSNTNDWFYGMAYGNASGNNMFVAVGYSGTLLTSPDGVAWTLQNSGDTHHLFGVGFGNGIFVAVGDNGLILASTDGITWNTVRAAESWNEGLNGVAFGTVNSIDYFVAVGELGTILTSPASDLANWTYRPSGTEHDLQAVAYDSTNQAFAAVGGFGTILLDGDTIPTNPVRVWIPHDVYFESLQTAYDYLKTGTLMDTYAINFNEDIFFDQEMNLTMRGG